TRPDLPPAPWAAAPDAGASRRGGGEGEHRAVFHGAVAEAPVDGVAGRVGEVGEQDDLAGSRLPGGVAGRLGDGPAVAAAAVPGRRVHGRHAGHARDDRGTTTPSRPAARAPPTGRRGPRRAGSPASSRSPRRRRRRPGRSPPPTPA